MFSERDGMLILSRRGETLRIFAQGQDGLRVQATMEHVFSPFDWAMEGAKRLPAHIEIGEEVARIENGRMAATVDRLGKIRFFADGKCVLEEYYRCYEYDMPHTPSLRVVAREYKPARGGDYSLTVRFESNEEKLYGMGQYQQSCLDLKGCTLELAQRNSQASVPLLISSRGYGFFWNNPAIGKATFAKNVTEWYAESTKQLDYWVTAGTPAEILKNYTELTGRAPEFPENALGLWQCKLRYRTQEEVLSVAREYHRRGIPLDVIVIDFFHWTRQGEWKFDKKYWPDPKAMVEELTSYGTRCMISIWPTVDKKSENFAAMREAGLLITPERGTQCFDFLGDSYIYDATNPQARAYIWDKCRQNYFDSGIDMFWLDEAEPEYTVYDFDNYRYFQGPAAQVGNIYPQSYARTFYEGLKQAGEEKVVSLLRCAWAGSQRYGALVWSGDIHSDWETLRRQVCAGLNMGIAGISWWTTDIGGFSGGNPFDPAFRQLLVRWFEWGCFCPVMRLHGDRVPSTPLKNQAGETLNPTGAANEVWSFGEENTDTLVKYIRFREAMRPYTKRVMEEAHTLGRPVMRPMFYEFPDQECCWDMKEQYMFGSDILVAPVVYEGQTKREVYLPAGATWTCVHDGKVYEGGQTVTADAPLEVIPVFLRDGKLSELVGLI